MKCTKEKELYYDGMEGGVKTNGVKITIIDFTMSRMTKGMYIHMKLCRLLVNIFFKYSGFYINIIYTYVQ